MVFKQTLYRWKIRKKPRLGAFYCSTTWRPGSLCDLTTHAALEGLRPNAKFRWTSTYINRVVFWQAKIQVVIDDKDFLKWESFSPNKKQAQLASRVKIKATRQPGIRRFFLIEWRQRKQRKWTNLDLPSRRSSENHHLLKSAKHGKGHVNLVNPGGYNFYRFASNRHKFQL